MAKERDSNFELLRIVCMLFIVSYHCLRDLVETHPDADIALKSAWIPLHIAVICFVLISGYFHIHPTPVGGGKLLLPVIAYYAIPGIILRICGVTDYIGGGQQVFFFLSKSPYWFIKAYFCLFLIAPVLNKYLEDTYLPQKAYLLAAMLFISVYGAMMGDTAYEDGKNIALFMTLYVLGDILKDIQPKIDKISPWVLLTTWLMLNAIIVFLYSHFESNAIGTAIWSLSFPYSSPLIIVEASLFFMLFSRISIKSRLINNIALSVFAVYILTEHSVIKPLLLRPAINFIYDQFNSSAAVIFAIMLFALIAMIGAIMFDMLCKPLFKIILNKIPK